jgi:hypothetical protein
MKGQQQGGDGESQLKLEALQQRVEILEQSQKRSQLIERGTVDLLEHWQIHAQRAEEDTLTAVAQCVAQQHAPILRRVEALERNVRSLKQYAS